MSRYKVSPRASHDLDKIWDFIAIERSRPVAAQNLLEKLRKTFALLASRPFIGQLRNEIFVTSPYRP
jgi:plasmid stabilization system protein ParE